ncbi:GNAT family N-acetyltransferase [Novosphingobium sp. PS1R-30]|uniref:GNAT family N-acetyltransferase n=1 Tax=Novosphingobium anseongense TaxID=3133436 RepID=A0ABU8S1Q9_9SPHN
MNTILIRPAKPTDLSALTALYWHLDAAAERCPPEKAASVFARFALYQGSAILLGLFENAPVTSCTVVVVPNLTHGGTPYALIENVVTHADYRNRGFGKAILHAAVELAWAEGCYKAMLMTGSKEASTLALYEAAGFEQSKTGFQVRRVPVRSE